jgi:Flp pilus assembly protein TadG
VRSLSIGDRSRSGKATVEVACCFPLFLLILLGIVEFGCAMSMNQPLNSAARMGCRSAILAGSSNSSVSGIVKQHVAGTLGCQQSHVTTTIAVTSSRTGVALSDFFLATTGDVIRLNVYVPFATVSWSVKDWLALIAETYAATSSPQIMNFISPLPSTSGVFGLVQVNHRGSPQFQGGGLQVQGWRWLMAQRICSGQENSRLVSKFGKSVLHRGNGESQQRRHGNQRRH